MSISTLIYKPIVRSRSLKKSWLQSINRRACTNPTFLQPNVLNQLLDQTDIFIFDCDGVLWKGMHSPMFMVHKFNLNFISPLLTGNNRISRSNEVIKRLKEAGKTIYFVTNNSTRSRVDLKKKFDNLDIDVSYDEILSSSFAAALFLTQKGFGDKNCTKKVYVVGEVGVCDELQMAGIDYIGGPAHSDERVNLSMNEGMKVDPDVRAVVAGLDTQINYHKIQYAQLCINELNSEFIATNTDEMAHLTSAQKWAGGGAIIGALRGCTGREPILVGKPSSFLIEHIFAKHNDVNPSRICMVGDRLNTDILFGLNHNLTTLLTLSGVTNKDLLLSDENGIVPHYYMNIIDDMLH